MKTTDFKAFLITPPLSEAYLLSLPKILDSFSVDWLMYRDSSPVWIPEFLRILKPYRKKLFLNLPFQNINEVIALSEGFDGVHLKSQFFPYIATLKYSRSYALGHRSILIGYSTHSIAEVTSALEYGADYCTLSPVFDTPNKGEPLGLEALEALPQALRMQTFALGGISSQHLERLRCLRFCGFAGISYFKPLF